MRCRFLFLLVLLLAAAPAHAWEDPDLGLRFPDPPGWELQASVEPGAGVSFYAPPGPGPRPSLGLRTCEVGEDLSRDLVQDVVRQLASEIPAFKLLGSRPDEVRGLAAWRLGYRAGLSGHQFRATQVLWVRSGRLFVLTLTSPPDRHDSLLPVLERTLQQLDFREEAVP